MLDRLYKMLRNKTITSMLLVGVLISIAAIQGNILFLHAIFPGMNLYVFTGTMFLMFLKAMMPFLGLLVLKRLKDQVDKWTFGIFVGMLVVLLLSDMTSIFIWILEWAT